MFILIITKCFNNKVGYFNVLTAWSPIHKFRPQAQDHSCLQEHSNRATMQSCLIAFFGVSLDVARPDAQSPYSRTYHVPNQIVNFAVWPQNSSDIRFIFKIIKVRRLCPVINCPARVFIYASCEITRFGLFRKLLSATLSLLSVILSLIKLQFVG